MVDRDRFQRLLRWYPRAWRDKNGEVVLGIMLDAAERDGRRAPTWAERWSAAGHGLGSRLGHRFAVVCALSALVAVAAAGLLSRWGDAALVAGQAPWILPTLTAFVGPVFVVAGAVALARERGLLAESRAVGVILVAILALATATLAQIAWSLGFDAADEGVPATGLAAGWRWLFVGAWAAGAAAIALLIDATLRRTRLRAPLAAIVSLIGGALLAPVVGIGIISPYTPAAAAVVVAVVVLGSRRVRVAEPAQAPRRAPTPAAVRIVPTRTRSAARLLAIISLLGSAFGVVYAVTGSQWGAVQDPTEAMAQGITVSLTAALPLLAAVGIIADARSARRRVHTWGPRVLFAVSLAAVAVAYRDAPVWEDMAGGFFVSSVVGALAVAWWTALRLPGTTWARAAIAVLVGIVLAAFFGVLIPPVLAFLLPLLAAAFAVWTPGRPSRSHDAPASMTLSYPE